MSRYLITGVAGFIASRIAEILLEQGHRVTGIDNLNDAYDVSLKKWRLSRLLQYKSLTFHHMDIAENEPLHRLVKAETQSTGSFDAVINLAARAGVRQSTENPWIYVDTNITGTLNLLEVCRQNGIGKFVQASSSSVYGGGVATPFREDQSTDKPASPYAASKKASELLCSTYHDLYSIDVSVLRYFTVYGPAGRPDMAMLRFVKWIMEGKPLVVYGDGLQARDFTYVDDIAAGTIAALKPVGLSIMNLGSDRPIVLRDAILLMEQILGRKAEVAYKPAHAADVPATWASIEKARLILRWEPKTSFEVGLERLVSWCGQEWQWLKSVRDD